MIFLERFFNEGGYYIDALTADSFQPIEKKNSLTSTIKFFGEGNR